MKETPTGTSVGVDDPYAHVDRCDHCTDEGTCRFAFERFTVDPTFAEQRRDDEYRCPVVHPDADREWDWADCPNFRSTTDGKECRRCGLEERRVAHDDARPLIEEHHLSYAAAGQSEAQNATEQASGGGQGSRGGDHEITVALCRWCHTTVHTSWGRIDDDVSPDPEAIAAREERRGKEVEEASFETAAERFGEE